MGLLVLLLVLAVGTLVAAGQHGGGMAEKHVPVTERFEKAIKSKEPRFKLGSKLKDRNDDHTYVLQGWKAGDKEVVSVSTYEFASAEAAAAMVQSSLTAPTSVPVRTIRLTNLGDEAYLSVGPYQKEGLTDLLFRKGNVVVSMTASSPGLVKRFAKHLAGAIGN